MYLLFEAGTFILLCFHSSGFFSCKRNLSRLWSGATYTFLLHEFKDKRCQSFSEKPYIAYQMKRFEKEFCFYILLFKSTKTKRYSSSNYGTKNAQKKYL